MTVFQHLKAGDTITAQHHTDTDGEYWLITGTDRDGGTIHTFLDYVAVTKLASLLDGIISAHLRDAA